jgi:hypothetical protein
MGEVGKEGTRSSHREDLLDLNVEYWHVLHGLVSGSPLAIVVVCGNSSVAGRRL